ncbi:endothelin-converting enzyme 2-like [Chenopodium quinoa]|uniref:endothelin-converting enzyme 2-like n=1 Tax=Chenopodium quinoa TaxID=63459 RepID=UPI000B790A3C|nr:endothelin-converting enzyme 2-like [Chenopodium quinoa]
MYYEEKNLKDTVVPSSVLTYLDPLYWFDDRFAKEEHYEWLKDYSYFRHLILENIQPNSSVLELGCGNSQLSDEMYKNGIKNIHGHARIFLRCTSFCAYSMYIKAMVADMLDFPFADDSFDVVIKRGIMDVLFVDSGDPWNPKSETISKVMAMLQGIHRVLKPNGIYISISFGHVVLRHPLFEAPDFTWSMKWSTFGDGFHYFFYTLKKLRLFFYGTRSLNSYQPCERLNLPSICLYQDELEGEDFLFKTNIDEPKDN